MNTSLLSLPPLSWLNHYMQWLHTRWPAGTVEKLPETRAAGESSLPGVRIVGDLTGIPLLKFSSDTGAKAVHAILAEPDFSSRRGQGTEMLDLAIIGAGVSGVAAAMEARKAGLHFKLYEATQVFSTVANFPKAKPIYTYPTGMTPAGDLQFHADVKEALLEEMEAQRKAAGIEVTFAKVDKLERRNNALLIHFADKTQATALRVIVAIGRSGNFRKLGCPGEDLDKVYNRLYDPKDFSGKNALVVGGGDSALETAIALAACGAKVTLSYRKKEFARPKPGNIEMLDRLLVNPAARVSIEQPISDRVTTAVNSDMRGDKPAGSITLALATSVKEVTATEAVLVDENKTETRHPNDVVFTMIGREAPLDFFRKSGIAIRGEWRTATWAAFLAFFAFCTWMYLWKAGGSSVNEWFKANGLFPFNIPALPKGVIAQDFAQIMQVNLRSPSFYYTLAYCVLMTIFGVRRIQRRKTPYVKAQTLSLLAFQWIPLFLLPFIVLPGLGVHGFLNGAWVDEFFPETSYGLGREYWRAFGIVLAWPLFVSNVFTSQPMMGWLIVSLIQTFVIIPFIVWRWGKGAYCGWICSCGGLAETMGDAHRQKMPHGPFWNRMNMVGQVILALALLILGVRIFGWLFPKSGMDALFNQLSYKAAFLGVPFNYYYVVDILLAGIVGVGCYFWFSGRVWCRFACPLAALMHIYARFSRFRIFPEKSKCISCNVCTSVCHQGIDVMNFANKGMPMEDPECVRCSACVQQCPTGVLSFGRYDHEGVPLLDQLAASNVKMSEAAMK